MAKIVGQPRKDVDTDHDGLSDWEEVNVYGSDPLDDDTNSDGISDGETVRIGFHPVTGQKLKDFFIPHEGNNYQPKSLQPKRVLFYIASAVIVKLIVVLFALGYPLSVWMSPDIAIEKSQEIIAMTNELRVEKGLPELIEVEELNQAARAKVEDMFINQYFAHVSPQEKNLRDFLNQADYKFQTAGENLAMGFTKVEDVFESWEQSPTHYGNLVDLDYQEVGVAVGSGLYQGGETILVAQYLARPQINIDNFLGRGRVLSETQQNDTGDGLEVISVDLDIDKPEGKKEVLVKINAELDSQTKQAMVTLLGQTIELEKNDAGVWQAYQLIDDSGAKSVTPNTISLVDEDGEAVVRDLSNKDINKQQSSLLSQYMLLKNNPDQVLAGIFNFSNGYIKILLFLACLALIFNIFVKIRKKPGYQPTLSGIILIIVLLMLMIF